MKTCAKCRECKPLSDFGARRAASDGLHPYCRVCVSLLSKAKYAANPERYKSYARQWSEANPERRRELDNRKARARYRRAPERVYAQARAWVAKNPEKVRGYSCAKKAARRARTKLHWDVELTRLATCEAAHLCVLREALTGVPWQLDHIIPLQCDTASGLHVAENFAVVPATYNAAKKNQLVAHRGFVVERRP